MHRLSNRAFTLVQVVALGGAGVVGFAAAPDANWHLELFLALAAFAIASECMAAQVKSAKVDVSGAFLSIVLAAAFLGALPAAIVGILSTGIGGLRWRRRPDAMLSNFVAYSWFPLIGGLLFHSAQEAGGFGPNDSRFYALLVGMFAVSLIANFLIVALTIAHAERRNLVELTRRLFIPQLPSELVAALLAVGVAFLYHEIGIQAIVLFAGTLFTYQYLMGRLLVSEERADELEKRTTQLASLQVGLLSALLRTLDLRDRMTARHSAAVARYAREIAAAAGLSDEEQELVHTAGLLHDIGKFIFPDKILKADTRLTDEDWNMIRTHPYQGAKIVSQVDGYGPVGEIILAHHERIDGKGYPRGLKGDEIPLLSRIISVADVYDVITARDSYRVPVSSFEAIHELRRVAGTQLDARFVDVFVELLAGKDVRYRHGEDADFDAELGLEKRVHAHAAPRDLPLVGVESEPERSQDADAPAGTHTDAGYGRDAG